MKACMFIGHRNAKLNSVQEEKLKVVVEDLIVKDKVTTFYFSNTGAFDKYCYLLVSDIKEKFPHIRRVYVCGKYPNAREEYYKGLLDHYEECYFPEEVRGAGLTTHIKTNQHIIKKVDYVVSYYDKNYFVPKSNSGTRLALDYARQKHKKIISLLN